MGAIHAPRLRRFRFSISGLRNLAAFRKDRLAVLQRASEIGEGFSSINLGPISFVLVNTPALAREIFVTQAEYFEKGNVLRENGRMVFGNGLVTSLNAFHKRQRRLIAPAFTHTRIGAYADVMATYAEQLQHTWADGETVDIAREMHRLTLWIVGKTLFDADLTGSEAAEVHEAMTGLQQGFNRSTTRIVRLPFPWVRRQERAFASAVARLDTIVYRMIAERRASGEDKGDLLSMLLKARDADDGSFMTDSQVRDEAMTLFLAGHETTANALTWTWYLLTQHPDIYAKLRAEVVDVLDGRTPTYADLADLPFTFQVFKEAMRLYPPVPMVVRQASQDVTVGGHNFPATTRFVISPYTMHRRAEYFPQPERFDPERFSPESEAKLPRDAYLPFVDGPRNCIGNSFAQMEGRIILATLVQRVTFDLVPGQKIEPEVVITLHPRNGIRVKVSCVETLQSPAAVVTEPAMVRQGV